MNGCQRYQYPIDQTGLLTSCLEWWDCLFYRWVPTWTHRSYRSKCVHWITQFQTSRTTLGNMLLSFRQKCMLYAFFIARQHTNARFLSRIGILTRDINIANLSVCPSVTFRNQMKTAQHIVIVFSPYGSPIVLLASNIFTQFRRGHPCGGAKYRWGIKNVRFSTNKSL